MNQIPNAVFTRQGPAITAILQAKAADRPDTGNWMKAYLAGGDLVEEIARLKAEDGKPILAHGGVDVKASIPQGLHGVAGLAAFLVSDEAGWITGRVMGAETSHI